MCPPSGTAQPQARGDAVGAVDPRTGLLYVFGGDVGPTVMCIPSPMARNDLWRYDATCDRWESLDAANPPSARARAASAYDSTRNRLIVFGGRFRAGTSGSYTLYNDVWALDISAQTWTQLSATAGPTPRANSAAAYDAVTDELLIYGGNTSASGASFSPQSDLWALSLASNTWRRVPAMGTPPSARLFHSMVLSGRSLTMFGGGGANAFQGPFNTDIWRMDLTSGQWTRLLDQHDAIVGRINTGMVPEGAGVLLLGGHDDGALGNRNDAISVSATGEVTVHNAGDTLDQPPAGFCDFPANFVVPAMGTPERRSAAIVAIDAPRNRVLVYGGKTDCGLANDVWIFDLATHRWQLSRGTFDGLSCQRQERTNCRTLCN